MTVVLALLAASAAVFGVGLSWRVRQIRRQLPDMIDQYNRRPSGIGDAVYRSRGGLGGSGGPRGFA